MPSIRATFPLRGKDENSTPPPLGEGARKADEGLPDGTMFESAGNFYALKNQKLLRWSFSGYTPTHTLNDLKLLTPPSIIAILQKGYEPRWHESAQQWD